MALAICQANHILLLIFYSPLLLQFLGGTHKTVKSLLIRRVNQDKPIKYQCSPKPVNSTGIFSPRPVGLPSLRWSKTIQLIRLNLMASC